MRTKNVQQTLDLSNIIRIPAKLIKRADQYLHPGDTLISSANWAAVGKACWVPNLPEPLAIGGFVTAPRRNRSTRGTCIGGLFPAFQEKMRGYSNQTTNIANLNSNAQLRHPSLRRTWPSSRESRRCSTMLTLCVTSGASRWRTSENSQAHYSPRCSAIIRSEVYLSSRDHESPALSITKGRRVSGPTTTVPYLAVVNVQSGHLNLDIVKEIEATAAEVERYSLRKVTSFSLRVATRTKLVAEPSGARRTSSLPASESYLSSPCHQADPSTAWIPLGVHSRPLSQKLLPPRRQTNDGNRVH